MYQKETTVNNASGLHARPASDFVKEAKKYQSAITVRRIDGKSQGVNAKSIVRLLSAGISKGSIVEVSAEGADEIEAVDALVSLIENGLGE